MIDNIWLTGF